MKSVLAAGLRIIMVFVLLGGFLPGTAWSQKGSDEFTEKLPPDVDPNSLSRMPRAKRDEFTADDDLKAFDHIMALDSRFAAQKGAIGGTLTRIHLPTVAEIYRNLLAELKTKSEVEPKYIEITILVSSRESNNALEWVDHVKNVAPNIVGIIKDKKDVDGLGAKEATLIRFGREMARDSKVSSKTFADMERLFGRKGTLAITLINSYYSASAMLMRTYDQHLNPGVPQPFPSE